MTIILAKCKLVLDFTCIKTDLMYSRFAMTVEAKSDNAAPVHIRTYKNPKAPDSYSNNTWKIWEAARATSAAPLYFEAMEKDGKTYLDGGMAVNNPIFESVTRFMKDFVLIDVLQSH